MSRISRERIPVVIGPCECPGTPHGDGDVVYLDAELSAPGGMAAQAAISNHLADQVTLLAELGRVYLRHGVVAWNLLDDAGLPLALTPDNVVAALPYGKGGREVADKADELYSEAILRPLTERLSSLSRTGSTVDTTSPEPTPMRPPSKRSSTPDTEPEPSPA